jgi:hypothetical protein
LFLPLATGGEQEFEFSEINRRFLLLPEKTQKEKNIEYFDLNDLIPKEKTIAKVSTAIAEAKEESSGILATIVLFFKAAFKWITNGFKWDEAKIEAGISHTQGKVNDKLNALAAEDLGVRDFLAQKDGRGQTVQDVIGAAVPAKVYEKVGVPVPEEFKAQDMSNIIANTQMGEPMKFERKGILSEVRVAVLYPDKENGAKGNLAEEITNKIFAGSEKIRQASEKEFEAASFFNVVARAKNNLTKELTLDSPQEAVRFGKISAAAIANGVSKAVESPEFGKIKNKEQAAEFIAKQVSKELEANRSSLVITKKVDGLLAQKAETSDDAKKLLPPKVGDHTYATVTLDTVKKELLEGVSSSITEDVYKQLQLAHNALIVSERDKERGKPVKVSAKAPDVARLPVAHVDSHGPPLTFTEANKRLREQQSRNH